MTEKFSESHDLPLYELADREKRTDEYIRSVLLQGGQLAHRVFGNEADAYEASDMYTDTCRKTARSIPKIEGVDLTASGEGVLVTNIKSTIDNNTGILSIETNPTECLVPLSMFESRAFHYDGVVAGVMEVDKGKWKVQPCVIGTESVKGQWGINSASFGFPLTKIGIESHIVIPCAHEDVHVEVDELVRHQQYELALNELAVQDDESIGLVGDITRIHDAFTKEHASVALFPEMTLLREIGKKGLQFGARDYKRADILNTALVKTIGVDRPLILDGKVYKADIDNKILHEYTSGFRGTVLEVVSQLPHSENHVGPTLVMMPEDDSQMHYIPLSSITALKYR